MKFIVGKKLKMTRVFDAEGNVVPVTAVEAKPAEVLALLDKEKVGYDAVKIKIVNRKKFKTMEFRIDASESEAFKVGEKLEVSAFAVDDKVKVIGRSKGKGFSGTIKRYNFHQGPKSHGSNQQRRVGSIGAAYPQHVLKGQKMPGHMGDERVTVSNLKIVDVFPDKNILLVSGAIPGNTGGEVKIISL